MIIIFLFTLLFICLLTLYNILLVYRLTELKQKIIEKSQQNINIGHINVDEELLLSLNKSINGAMIQLNTSIYSINNTSRLLRVSLNLLKEAIETMYIKPHGEIDLSPGLFKRNNVLEIDESLDGESSAGEFESTSPPPLDNFEHTYLSSPEFK
jgi:hypothetical protein